MYTIFFSIDSIFIAIYNQLTCNVVPISIVTVINGHNTHTVRMSLFCIHILIADFGGRFYGFSFQYIYFNVTITKVIIAHNKIISSKCECVESKQRAANKSI